LPGFVPIWVVAAVIVGILVTIGALALWERKQGRDEGRDDNQPGVGPD
jgi:hypothetical protein